MAGKTEGQDHCRHHRFWPDFQKRARAESYARIYISTPSEFEVQSAGRAWDSPAERGFYVSRW